MVSLLWLLSAVLACHVVAERNISVPISDSAIYVDSNFAFDNDSGCKTYWTGVQGAAASFEFMGTGVYIIGSKSSYGGEFDVYLDGIKISTVDRYADSPTVSCGHVLWSYSNMKYVNHLLRMTFVGKSGASQQPGYFDIQSITYAVPDNATITTSSSTSTRSGSSNSSVPSPSTSKSNGPLIGGIVGAIVAVALIVGGVLLWLRSRRNRRQARLKHSGPTDVTASNQRGSIGGAYTTEPFDWPEHQGLRASVAPNDANTIVFMGPMAGQADPRSRPQQHQHRLSHPLPHTGGPIPEKSRSRRASAERAHLPNYGNSVPSSGPVSRSSEPSSDTQADSSSHEPPTLAERITNVGGGMLTEPDVARIAQAVLAGLHAQSPPVARTREAEREAPPPAYPSSEDPHRQ